MAISLDEYDKINAAMPKDGRGDEIELSASDEACLDKAWQQVAEEKAAKS